MKTRKICVAYNSLSFTQINLCHRTQSCTYVKSILTLLHNLTRERELEFRTERFLEEMELEKRICN